MAFATIVSHFAAMLLFAFLVSIILASLSRRTPAARVRYALWCFFLFCFIGIGVAWLMFPLSR